MRRHAQPVLPADELRRRRREALLIGITAMVFAVFALFQTRLPEFSYSPSQSGNIIFFLLINLNLILLVLLMFLVTRNLVKLIFERRRGILGARLRTRLVLAFVSLTLFPTLLLFVVAEGFLSAAIESWFGRRVESSLTASLEVAHRFYQSAGNNALHFATEVGRQIDAEGLLRPSQLTALRQFVAAKRRELNVGGIEIMVGQETIAAAWEDRLRDRVAPIDSTDLKGVLIDGQEFARTQPISRGDMVRGGVPIRGVDGAIAGAVVVDVLVPRAVSKAARRAARSDQEYRQLRVLKQPIRNSYTLSFLLITLVVLFSATWFGFRLAKGITVPIQRLGEGMREVAQGNWDYQAEAGGDEEVATLVDSFNQMTGELKTIHSALEERRRYIENILANITAGVVSVDPGDAVVTVNPAAGAMLGISAEDARGRDWREVFGRSDLQPIGELLLRLRDEQRERVEQQVKLAGGNRPVTAWVTATRLADDRGMPRGSILFFEDVTHLLRVERMEAWREVARRIAHEIKNPLTPIQLSAQRLRTRFGSLGAHEAALFEECTRTIINQVEQLKRLVNEFSAFARLPALEVAPHDLNQVVDEALVLFREGHRDIAFEFTPDPSLPLIEIDREAVKRAVINLLDNAVAACQIARGAGKVDIVTAYGRPLGVVRLEVADNGCGMTADVKARAFEPYYSTKKDGTGLGLAIVSAIAADHHAYVRIRDNAPQGARLVIEFPLRQAAAMRAVARA